MSKAKPLKIESSEEQEGVKRELLEQSVTIRRLQQRISRLTEQNYEIISARDRVQQQYQDKIDHQRIIIESHEHTINTLRHQSSDLELKRITLVGILSQRQNELKSVEETSNKELEEYKRNAVTEITKLQMQLKEYNVYMAERDKKEEENKRLKMELIAQNQKKEKEVADKEREKVQENDRLRDQMVTRIDAMKSNLMSLKKEQLSTTTKLAVLQNHQLASELQFQSKNSEKLIFQNQQLSKKVSNLQKDIQIHKDIEDQLAKRSHYSRGIIKKLTNRITQLQNMLKTNNNNSLHQTVPQQISSTQPQLIQTLTAELQSAQKKCASLNLKVQQLKSDLQLSNAKQSQQGSRNNSIVDLLKRQKQRYFRYYQETTEESDAKYDLKKMKEQRVEEWTGEEVKMVVRMLLTKIAPHLAPKHFLTTLPPELSLTEQKNIRLPKISEHSAVAQKGRNVQSLAHLTRKYKVIDR